MTAIWLNGEHTAIKSYGATVRGPRAIVKVEIEVTEPGCLGFLLEDLARCQAELKQGKAKKKSAAGEPRSIEGTELQALPFYGERG